MAPTPPSVDAASSASPHSEDRTRRNVACVNCRNSKVRCRSSTVPGQPCQRCAKLQLSCVVDKFHKRVTKRSKLELLEQELKNIKEVVNPRNAAGETTWTPPSPRQPFPNVEINLAASRPTNSSIPQAPTPASEPSAVAPPSAQITERRPKTGPTQSRALGDHVVSGEDIDWYFNKFLQCLHPFLPILAKRDPDECYDASPILFWVILYVTCRRYTKDRVFFQAVVDHIEQDIWKAVAVPATTLETVHAVLFLCAWPLPSLRLLVDPSTNFISLITSGAMLLGLHTGRGSSKEFCVGARRECIFSDEEAASTWFACCSLATKIAVHSGIPPTSIHLDDTNCRTSLEAPFWNDLVTAYDLSKFLNRMHTAVAAQLSSQREVPHTMMVTWEQEFEALRPSLIQNNTDVNVFLAIAAQLEIQIYYFSMPGTTPEHIQRLNFTRAFHTARTLIASALDQETRSQFLTHAPQQAFRALASAACITIAILYSTSAPDMAPNDANVIAQQAVAAVHRCSVQEGDLPHRIGVILETFWSFKHHLPRFEIGPRAWPGRFGAGLTYWCLDMFKNSLHRAQKNNESAGSASRAQESGNTNQAQKGVSTRQGNAANQIQQAIHLPPQQQHSNPQLQQMPQQQMPLGSDPFQEIDWSMFMDDFGWVGDEGVLLGLP